MISRLKLTFGLSAAVLTACATPQENPYYEYSSQYKGAPTTMVAQVPAVLETALVSYEAISSESASYQSVATGTYTRVNHECLKKEKNHELLGSAIGGTIGAIAGEKLIGGTEGVVIGAGLGGAAGYGIGDKAVNCDPQPISTVQSAPVVSAAYVSPTDEEFRVISDTGTPGYQVMSSQTVEAYNTPATTSTHFTAPQEVTYDYSANTITASAATQSLTSENRILSAQSYQSHVVGEGDTVYSLSRGLCVGVVDIQSLNGLDANYGIRIGESIKLPSSNC